MQPRRYEIDWIRVIVFDILIIYHVGMFFVPWGWHLKNDEIVGWIQFPMLFVNQWRIPILFVVSGIGTWFAMVKRNGMEYFQERVQRLFVPLVAGVLIIVPPQVYIERLATSEFFGSYISFYPGVFDGIYPNGNFSWHHLWFLPYLLLFSIFSIPFFAALKEEGNQLIIALRKVLAKHPWLLLMGILPLLITDFFLEPYFPINHAIVGDWYGLAKYFSLFFLGYLMAGLGESFWAAVVKMKNICLITGVLTFPVLLWLWWNFDPSIYIPIVRSINTWVWILAVFGFAARFLNRPSEVLNYRNQAVYPFYILHQTITLSIGFWLLNTDLHYVIKTIVMIVGTFGGCWILYEFAIRRVRFLRPLFGLRQLR